MRNAGSEPAAGRLARLAGPSDALFVYGTLQFPEVLVELIGRCPASVPAQVPGWRVAALPGRIYPGLVPDPDTVARGVVLSGLDAGEWAVLDGFEDDEYDLRLIHPGGERAWTYVWTAEVTSHDWHPSEFAATHLPAFAARCGRWRPTA
ncbi:gamma-glutamylcyclotransferase family protein [Nocardia sp. NPDC050710]|uniref:gamma-glutamylcyclotransferase family protein n=1 Tax=Nocardia sp. NPDC050710 TaxID=3157220 RepID=UPI0033FCAC4E